MEAFGGIAWKSGLQSIENVSEFGMVIAQLLPGGRSPLRESALLGLHNPAIGFPCYWICSRWLTCWSRGEENE